MKEEKTQELTLNFALPETKELLEAGVHFGHETKRWNPKMREYIYSTRGKIHIIDLAKTQTELVRALKFLKSASRRGDVIFVGTKRQACDIVVSEALRCGAHYVSNRWAGGLLTNYTMLRKSLKSFLSLEKQLVSGVENRTKQEIAWMKKDYERFIRLYEGVKHLSSKPAAVVVIDPKREKLAVKEAKKAGIPVVALADTNADPDMIDYLIPCNDDAISAIELIMKLVSNSVLEGNEGKRLVAIRKSYEAEMSQLKDLAKAAKEKKRIEKEQKKEETAKLRAGTLVRIVENPVKEIKAEEKEEKVVVKKKLVTKDLTKLNLSARTIKALEDAEIDYEKLSTMSIEDVKEIKGVGPKSLEEIQEALAKK